VGRGLKPPTGLRRSANPTIAAGTLGRWKQWDGESRRRAEGGKRREERKKVRGGGAKILWWWVWWNEKKSGRVIERLSKKTEFEVPTTAQEALQNDLNAE